MRTSRSRGRRRTSDPARRGARARAGPSALTMPLDQAQLATLDAALARLIPTDDGEPGAREAQVLRYVERALDGVHRGHLAAYRRGLGDLDELALAWFGAAFAALADVSQDAVLRDA